MRNGLRGLAAGALTLATLAAGRAGVRQAQRAGAGDGKTTAGLQLPGRRCASACSSRSAGDRPGQRRGHDRVADRHHPARRSPGRTEGPGDHRSDSPYYTSVGPRQRDAVHPHDCERRRSTSSRCSTTTTSSRAATPYILAQTNGTAYSTGCPLHGGPGDVAGFKAVVDWLEGRVPGYTTVDRRPRPVTAPRWSNGKNAMIGKSYDGTFANGVAATGVDGLTTIVPISAISAWYDYSRMGGIRHNTHYPRSLDNSITGTVSPAAARRRVPAEPPHRRAPTSFNEPGHRSTATPTATSTRSGTTATTTRTSPRSRPRSSRRTASTTTTSARTTFSQWWAGLAANNVPRKLWLSARGPRRPVRVPPRRLGRHAAPLVRLLAPGRQQRHHERAARRHRAAAGQRLEHLRRLARSRARPASGRVPRRPARPAARARSALTSGGATDTLAFTGPGDATSPRRTCITAPNGQQASRLVFLSPKLKPTCTCPARR